MENLPTQEWRITAAALRKIPGSGALRLKRLRVKYRNATKKEVEKLRDKDGNPETFWVSWDENCEHITDQLIGFTFSHQMGTSQLYFMHDQNGSGVIDIEKLAETVYIHEHECPCKRVGAPKCILHTNQKIAMMSAYLQIITPDYKLGQRQPFAIPVDRMKSIRILFHYGNGVKHVAAPVLHIETLDGYTISLPLVRSMDFQG